LLVQFCLQLTPSAEQTREPGQAVPIPAVQAPRPLQVFCAMVEPVQTDPQDVLLAP
jgi:hypothetical protein